jgi:hypothetical protein
MPQADPLISAPSTAPERLPPPFRKRKADSILESDRPTKVPRSATEDPGATADASSSSVTATRPAKQKSGMQKSRKAKNKSKSSSDQSKGEKSFMCTFPGCKVGDRHFARSANLRKHFREVHDGWFPEDYVTCESPGCREAFPTKDSSRKHWNRVHNPVASSPQIRKDGFQCPYSGCTSRWTHPFSVRSIFIYHIKRIHKGWYLEEWFRCGALGCEDVFQTERGLNRHMASCHEDIKPYECSSCEDAFINLTQLNTHRKAQHRIPNPWECTVHDCTSSYAEYRGLWSHTMSCHLGDYKCSVCEYIGSSITDLNHHNMSNHSDHPDAATYECSYCPALFVTLDQRRSHMLHHDEHPVAKCISCRRTYPREDFSQHQKECRELQQREAEFHKSMGICIRSKCSLPVDDLSVYCELHAQVFLNNLAHKAKLSCLQRRNGHPFVGFY